MGTKIIFTFYNESEDEYLLYITKSMNTNINILYFLHELDLVARCH